MSLILLAGLLSAVLWYFDFGIIAAICGYFSFISFAMLSRPQALFVILIATGYKIFVLPRPDGSYTVILNAKMCRAGQVAAFNEELRHISGGDFDRIDRANIVERMRHACG